MKKILFIFYFSISFLVANNAYVEQVKVIDRCTYLVEPLTIKSLGIKGANVSDFEAQKAIRACEKSFEAHPDDPHVQFLLARAYTKGTAVSSDMNIPKSVRLLIPELNDVSPQYEKGYYLAKKSCENGDLGGCTLLGYYSYARLYKRKFSSKKAYLLWLWACTKGNPKACQNLSGIIKKGKGPNIPRDLKSSHSYSLDACISNLYPRACDVYSDQNALRDFNVNEDINLYVNYNACISGSNNACYFLRKILDQNGSSENQKKLHHALKLSCSNGNAKACRTLGELYSQLPKNKVNNMMASLFFEDGCMNGAESFSCWHAGHYKVYPKVGLTKDIDLGLSYWEKSCYIGRNTFACNDLAQFYMFTDNVTYKDLKKATKALKYACQLGNHNACNDLEKFTDDATHDDLKKVIKLFKDVCQSTNYDAVVRGCEQGMEECCKRFN